MKHMLAVALLCCAGCGGCGGPDDFRSGDIEDISRRAQSRREWEAAASNPGAKLFFFAGVGTVLVLIGIAIGKD